MQNRFWGCTIAEYEAICLVVHDVKEHKGM